MKPSKHNQTKNIIVLKDLFKCVPEVENLDYVLGIGDCGEVVKISIENLAELITAVQA